MSDHASRMSAIELEDALRFIARRKHEDAILGCPDSSPRAVPRAKGGRRERLTPYGVAAFSRDPEHIERLANGDVQTSAMIYSRSDPMQPHRIVHTRRSDGRIAKRTRNERTVTAAVQTDTARFSTGHDFTS